LDNLTHSLVGLFLARAGFRYATPRATAIMVVAANIPDLDVVSWLGGGEAYIRCHRNITHSLIAAPLMALLAVGIVRLVGRAEIRWLNSWLIALLAVASHLLLDLTNTYGVRLLLPFSGRWFHLDITPVIDLTLWAILLLGAAAPFLTRLVGSEIGERRSDSGNNAGNAGWAVIALLLFSAYDYTRSVLHDQATALMDAHVYNGLAPRRVGAFPEQNPLLWTGVAELSNAFVTMPLDLRGSFHSVDEQTWPKPPRTPAVEAALRTAPFERLLEFVQWPLWDVEPGRVTLVDLRFGAPRDALFEATATIDDRNRVVEAHFLMSPRRPR
jgi:inner membrane protein